ncbi:MAG: RDD family protein [Candidatus Eisenbacteria bacterium]
MLYFPAATVRVLLGLPAVNTFSTIDVDSNASMIASALELFIDWLYVAFLVSSRSRATLGMMVMDLELTRLDGERVSFSRATWRYFAQFLSVLTVGFGYVMQVFTARRQTLHDMVTSTVVVRAGRKVVPLGAPAVRTLA